MNRFLTAGGFIDNSKVRNPIIISWQNVTAEAKLAVNTADKGSQIKTLGKETTSNDTNDNDEEVGNISQSI